MVGMTEGILVASVVVVMFGGKLFTRMGRDLGQSIRDTKHEWRRQRDSIKSDSGDTESDPDLDEPES